MSVICSRLSKGQKLLFITLSGLFFVVLALLLLSANMQKGLNHDEYIYVSSGKLLASGGLLPYRDYPYLQMPNLVFVYAILFSFTSHLLLAARLFSTACALLICGLLFYTSTRLFGGYHYLLSFLISVSSVLLLVANPLFIYTSGLAWNHDFPLLLSVAAALIWCYKRRTTGWLVLTGLLLAFAVGTRLSFAPLLLPFTLAVLIEVRAHREKARRQLALFGLGATAGILPALVTFVLAPQQFIFGNVEYHRLNETYRSASGYTRAMTLSGKVDYMWPVFGEAGTFFLLVAVGSLVAIVVILVRWWRVRLKAQEEFLFLVSLLPFLLAGILAPTPSWYQYFYALTPFLILALLYGVKAVTALREKGKWGITILPLLAIISIANGLPAYTGLGGALLPERWVPNEVHRAGLEISAASKGEVLTLAPLLPLEGGAAIYPQFVTGPFIWRIGPYLPPGEERAMGLVTQRNLESFLSAQPPQSIYVGREADQEGPLADYARAHGYSPRTLTDGTTLWLAP
ncbi:MAG: hypothetical protein IVW55_13630 [Chloroflexi bacterium]|nr:hypothetical protein [Chloroflexota bacterium]